jgi:CTP:molybdopterin cytidylyltransferase MocA/uncharacterized damage-inducible protein DinB
MAVEPARGEAAGPTRPQRTAVAGILLAAGGSSRLGQPKQLLRDATGTSRVRRAASDLLEAGCAPVLVVTGAEADAVAAELAGLPVQLVHHPGWADGMGTTIAAGVAALAAAPATPGSAAHGVPRPPRATTAGVPPVELPTVVGGVLIAACDMPGANAPHLARLVAAFTGAGAAARVASAYAGGVGIPAVFPRTDWPALASLAGDRGAKPLLQAPGTLSVALAAGSFDDGERTGSEQRLGALDLDTPDDVSAWRRADAARHSPAPTIMSSLATIALGDLDPEMASTRRLLERIPDDQLDAVIHARSWPLRKMATHVATLPMWGTITVTTDELDFAKPQPPAPTLHSSAELVAAFDEQLRQFKAALAATDDAALQQPWTLRSGEQVMFRMPRLAVLRTFVINHMIHHRAQLTMYLRLLDVPVPGLYGPSADEV